MNNNIIATAPTIHADQPRPSKPRRGTRNASLPNAIDGAPGPDDNPPQRGKPNPKHDNGSPRPCDPGPCPVRAIGLLGARFFFFDRLGQTREVGAHALASRAQIMALFGGDTGMEWLRNRFPHFDRKGLWTSEFNVRDCGNWLMGECVRKGLRPSPGAEADPEQDKVSPRPRDPGPCPVCAVGLAGGGFFFFDFKGQLREVGAQSLASRAQIMALFGGDVGLEWLRNRFPHFDRKGRWTGEFNVRDCGNWLMGECARKGLLNLMGQANSRSAAVATGLPGPRRR